MKLLHHSTADWQHKVWSAYSAGWYLDASSFISPPTSLSHDARCTASYCHAYAGMCFLPSAGRHLPQGRIVTWHREGFSAPKDDGWSAVFLGLSQDFSTYTHCIVLPKSTSWVKARFTWWDAYDYHNEKVTRVRIEHWVDPDWIQDSQADYPSLTEPNTAFAIGLHTYKDGTFGAWLWGRLDDTEIWATT